jgi:hypothetical protein
VAVPGWIPTKAILSKRAVDEIVERVQQWFEGTAEVLVNNVPAK